MKCFCIIIILFFFISCGENSTPPNTTTDKGYIILTQGATSSIDVYDIKTNELKKDAFQAANNAETLSGYAENIFKSDSLIFITLQGSFSSGEGGKVVVTNHSLNKVTEVGNPPQGYNTLYVSFETPYLYVTYRNGENNYRLRKYKIAKNNNRVTFSQSGGDYQLGLTGYGYGRFKVLNNFIYTYSDTLIEVINKNTLAKIKSFTTPKGLQDIEVHKNKVYISYIRYGKIAPDSSEAFQSGGYYIIDASNDTSSVPKNYGFTKLHSDGESLYAIKWNVSSRKYLTTTFSYIYKNLTTSLVSWSNDAMEQTLFENPVFQNLTSSWLHFNYDTQKQCFLVPDGSFSNSKLYQFSRTGSILKTTEHSAQAIETIIIP